MAKQEKAAVAKTAEKEAAKAVKEEKRMNGDDWSPMEDSEFEGEVCILGIPTEESPENQQVIEGIYCGPGRVIGDGDDQIGTHMIYVQEEDVYKIIPAHTTLSSLGELKEGETMVRITYLGKRESKASGRKYHNYRIQYKQADQTLVRGLDYAVKNV